MVGDILDLDKVFPVDNDLSYFRFILFAGVVAYPLFNFVYGTYFPGYDPMPFSQRLISSAFFGVLLGLTYISDYFKNRIIYLMYLGASYAFLQLIYLSIINTYSLNYSLSIIVVIMVLNFLFKGDYKLRYLNVFMVTTVLTTVFISETKMNEYVYSLTVLFISSTSYILSRSRHKGQRKYENLFNNSPIGLVQCNNQGDILNVNRNMKKIFENKTKEELLNMNIFNLLDLEKSNIETIITKNGEEENEKKLTLSNEEEMWINYSIKPIFEKQRNKGLIVAFRNITRRKRVEEKDELLHSLLRHDVRNKIQIVKGYLRLLDDFDHTQKAEEYLEKSDKAIQNSIELINKVGTLKRLEEEKELQETNLNKIINNSIDNRKVQAQEKEIKIKKEETKQKVLAGPLLEEVFSNLIENSIQHANCNQIKIRGKETEQEYTTIIEDDGKGIPDKTKNKIFDKNFKSEESTGSGLGMYLVKQIIKTYNGKIKVKDSDLGGAKFEISLQKP